MRNLLPIATLASKFSVPSLVALILFLQSELRTSVFCVPLSQVDVLSLIDPITQFQDESEVKKVIPKSVFNVPIKGEPSLPPCPPGSRRVTPTGTCNPLTSGIRLDDQFLLQSFSFFNRRKPTSPMPIPSNTNRRRKTTTTPQPPPVPVPTYVIEEEDGTGSGAPLNPVDPSRGQGPTGSNPLGRPTYQIQNTHYGTTVESLPETTPENSTKTSNDAPITLSPTTPSPPETSQEPQPKYPTVSSSPESIQPTISTITALPSSTDDKPQETTSQNVQYPIGEPEDENVSSTQSSPQEITTLLPTLPIVDEDGEGTTLVDLETETMSPEFDWSGTEGLIIGEEESSSHQAKEMEVENPTTRPEPEPHQPHPHPPSIPILFRDESDFINMWHPTDSIVFPQEEEELASMTHPSPP